MTICEQSSETKMSLVIPLAISINHVHFFPYKRNPVFFVSQPKPRSGLSVWHDGPENESLHRSPGSKSIPFLRTAGLVHCGFYQTGPFFGGHPVLTQSHVIMASGWFVLVHHGISHLFICSGLPGNLRI